MRISDWSSDVCSSDLHARKPRAGKRHEFLSAADFAKMGQALADLETEGGNPIGIAVLRMTMLTGARPGEIEGLTWAEVDMENQCLRLAQSKTGDSARPLSQAAVSETGRAAGRERVWQYV